MVVRKKYFKIILGLSTVFFLVIMGSVIFEEFTATRGMVINLITARPYDVYVSRTKWQIKSGRASDYLDKTLARFCHTETLADFSLFAS